MENSANKLEYIKGVFDFDEYVYAVCKSSHYIDGATFKGMIRNVKYSFTDEYDLCIPPKYIGEKYIPKGFVSSSGSYVSTGTPDKREDWNADNFNPEMVGYIYKIIEFCKNENIELILISCPVTQDRLNEYYDYKELHERIVKIADDNGIEFYDFNYDSPIAEVFGDECFLDISHLNSVGAEKFSNALAKVLYEE